MHDDVRLKLELPIAYPKEKYSDIFPEVIASAGLTQFRCAETEKYAHVTYFFNGGREEPFAGEERTMIPSPKDVATYDLKPEMGAAGVADAVVKAIESDGFDFVVVNFANPDMVGHTGNLEAAITAVQVVDKGIARIADAVRAKGGALIITADHGNCELMGYPKTGQPHTAHTLICPLLMSTTTPRTGRSAPAGASATSPRRCSRSWASRSRRR